MKLILHQLRTDWLHFRAGLAVLWVLFVALVWLTPSLSVPALPFTPRGLMTVLVALLTALLVVQCVQADPFSGSDSAWMTRSS